VNSFVGVSLYCCNKFKERVSDAILVALLSLYTIPLFMKKTLVVAALLVAVIYGCRQTGNTVHSLLETSRLKSQLFSIDITHDTTLVTQNGAVIKLPKGTLKAEGTSSVQLEIREAYSMQDIIRAGLITLSNGQPLSSGGMIYINPVEASTVKIVKPIFVAIPTSFIDSRMQLFKGEVKADSTINWTNPQALPANPQQAKLEQGKTLFINNCAPCHAIGKDLTGPNLAHVMKRLMPRVKWEEGSGITHPYEFTRNNPKVLTHDCYYLELYNLWNKTPMPVYPNLTREELDNLYGYIENESDRLQLPVPDNGIMQCLDSCNAYLAIEGRLEKMKRELEQDSFTFVKEERFMPPPVIVNGDSDTSSLIPVPALDFVNPLESKSLYYQFSIEAFGWYNIDILMKEIGAEESSLLVRMEGGKKASFALYLAIPSIKGLFPGGELAGKKGTYGFYTKDGKIPLPQDTQAYLFAVGERDSTILFAGKTFTTSVQQEFTLQLSVITEEAFQQEIEKMGLPDLKMQVAESQTGIEIRKVIRELKNAKQLKPKNCRCDCVTPEGAIPQPTGISFDTTAVSLIP
jgi:mono/diheme cytochrome c family protein